MAELLLGSPVSNFAENVARDVTACDPVDCNSYTVYLVRY